MKKTLRAFVVVGITLFTAISNAQVSGTPSAQQVEQFKKLPKDKQKILAKQLGFDLNLLQGMSGIDKGTSGQNLQSYPEQQYLMQNQNMEEMSEVEEEEELKPFGYEMFERMQEAFLPNGNVPVPADYIIGPGDSLNVSYYGKEFQSFTADVDNEGKIALADIEPIMVSGLTLSELKEYVKQVTAEKLFGVNAVVSMGELRTIQVYVLGDVKKPGAYQLSSLSTMANALFISGGPNQVGSLRDIRLRRAGKELSQLDLYEFMLNGDIQNDKRLQQGDVIFVSQIKKQISVVGEVRRPAIYEIKSEETIKDAINFAGGLTPNGYPKSVEITSFNENFYRTIFNIDLTDKASYSKVVNNGDLIKVHESAGRIDDAVNIAGYVARPGAYTWREGVTLVELLKSPAELLIGADFNYGLVVSNLSNPGEKIQTKQFSPEKMFSGKQTVELTKGDLVLFFNNFDKTTYYKDEGHVADLLERRADVDRMKKFNRVNRNFSNAFSELSSIFGDGEELKAEESDKVNYVYKILFGDQTEKFKAFPETQKLTREELIQPIVQLMEQQVLNGQNINVIEVRGEVRFPGNYPINENTSASQAIWAAGGLKESASTYKAEISRISNEQNSSSKINHISIDLSLALAENNQSNLTLSGRDVVNVFEKTQWNDQLRVTLRGEVRFPGVYEVNEGESLAEVVVRAGGLTDKASPESAFFTRRALKELEEKQAKVMARALSKELALKSMSSSTANLNVQEVQSLVSNLSEVEGVGRLIIDLPQVLSGNTADIELEDGDMLAVPSRKNEINIIGEVQVPTSYVFNSEWRTSDYIKASGGFRAQADEDRVYIVRANGLVDVPELDSWFSADEYDVLYPGDTIVIPLDAGHVDQLTLWEKATAIFYQATVGIAAILKI